MNKKSKDSSIKILYTGRPVFLDHGLYRQGVYYGSTLPNVDSGIPADDAPENNERPVVEVPRSSEPEKAKEAGFGFEQWMPASTTTTTKAKPYTERQSTARPSSSFPGQLQGALNEIYTRRGNERARKRSDLGKEEREVYLNQMRTDIPIALSREVYYYEFLHKYGLSGQSLPPYHQIESIEVNQDNQLIVTEKPTEPSDQKPEVNID